MRIYSNDNGVTPFPVRSHGATREHIATLKKILPEVFEDVVTIHEWAADITHIFLNGARLVPGEEDELK